jgi:hypothetical protein
MVIEQNHGAQFAPLPALGLLRLFRVPPQSYNRPGPLPLRPAELCDRPAGRMEVPNERDRHRLKKPPTMNDCAVQPAADSG